MRSICQISPVRPDQHYTKLVYDYNVPGNVFLDNTMGTLTLYTFMTFTTLLVVALDEKPLIRNLLTWCIMEHVVIFTFDSPDKIETLTDNHTRSHNLMKWHCTNFHIIRFKLQSYPIHSTAERNAYLMQRSISQTICPS